MAELKRLSFTPLSTSTTPAATAAQTLATPARKSFTPLTEVPKDDADDETWLDWIGSTSKDLAVGAAKSLMSQGIRGGQLLRQIPGVNALDALMTPIPVNTEPSNTTQKVGGLMFDVAESINPAKAVTGMAMKAASALPKAATMVRAGIEGAGAAGISAVQGGDPTTAAVFGAGIPVAGALAGAKVAGIRDKAVEGVAKFMGAQKNRFVDMVERRTPEILQRGLHGTRDEVLDLSKAKVAELRSAIEAAQAAYQGKKIPTADVLEFLEDSKNAFRESTPVPLNQLLSNPQLAATARQLPDGTFVTDTALSDTARRSMDQLEKLKGVIQSLGPEVEYEKLLKVRKAWDFVVNQAGGFTERSGRGVAMDLNTAAEAWAAREGGKELRKLLAEAAPDVAKLNEEFTFWKDMRDVLVESKRRGLKQMGSTLPEKAETAGRLVGTAGSVAGGSGVIGSITGGFALGKVAKMATRAFQEPKWKLVGANLRTKLADAIISNKPSDVANVLARILAVQAGKLGQDE